MAIYTALLCFCFSISILAYAPSKKVRKHSTTTLMGYNSIKLIIIAIIPIIVNTITMYLFSLIIPIKPIKSIIKPIEKAITKTSKAFKKQKC